MAFLKLYKSVKQSRITGKKIFIIKKDDIVKPKRRLSFFLLSKITCNLLKLFKFVKHKRTTGITANFDRLDPQKKNELTKIKILIKANPVYLRLYIKSYNERPERKIIKLSVLAQCVSMFLKLYKKSKTNALENWQRRRRSTAIEHIVALRVPVKVNMRTLSICVLAFLKLHKQVRNKPKQIENKRNDRMNNKKRIKLRYSFKTVALAVISMLKIYKLGKTNRKLKEDYGIVLEKYVKEKYNIRSSLNLSLKGKPFKRLQTISRCILVFMTLYRKIKKKRLLKLLNNESVEYDDFKSDTKYLNSEETLSPKAIGDFNMSSNFFELKKSKVGQDITKKSGSFVHIMPLAGITNPIVSNEIRNYESETRQNKTKKDNLRESSRQENNLNKMAKDVIGHDLNSFKNIKDEDDKIKLDFLNFNDNPGLVNIKIKKKKFNTSKENSEINDTKKSSNAKQTRLMIKTMNNFINPKEQEKRPRLYYIVLSVMAFRKLYSYIQYKRENFGNVEDSEELPRPVVVVNRQRSKSRLYYRFRVIAKSVLTFVSLLKFVRQVNAESNHHLTGDETYDIIEPAVNYLNRGNRTTLSGTKNNQFLYKKKRQNMDSLEEGHSFNVNTYGKEKKETDSIGFKINTMGFAFQKQTEKTIYSYNRELEQRKVLNRNTVAVVTYDDDNSNQENEKRTRMVTNLLDQYMSLKRDSQ